MDALPPPPVALFEMVTAAWATQALYVAAKLGIADKLAAGPLTADELAEQTGAKADAIARLLRQLSSRGVFASQPDGRWALTGDADALRTDSPVSIRDWVLFVGSPKHWEHWAALDNSVQTGQTSVPVLRGKPMFDYLQEDREFGAVFNNAMIGLSNIALGPVLSSYDFSRFGTIVDIAGGHGRLLAAILQQTPGARGVLFDLPFVAETATRYLADAGVGERCTVVAGSFFDAVPSDGDAYLLKHIVHDWDEPEALRMLQNIRAAIPDEGTLLIIEFVLPADNSPHFGKLLDLEMLLVTGGRERTAAQYAQLLAKAGFRQTQVVPTASPISIVEAVPA